MKKRFVVLFALLLVFALLAASCAQVQKLVDQLPDEVVDVIPGVEKSKIPDGALKYWEDNTAGTAEVGADDKTLLPEELTIPKKSAGGNTVDTVASYGFEDCTNLKKVIIPDSVEKIKAGAFWACTNLTEVTMEDLVAEIQSGAFKNCSSLTTIKLSANIRRIAADTFAGCTSLTSITLPDNIDDLGVSAFEGCTALTSISLPSSLYYISANAFLGTALSSITFRGTMDEWEDVVLETLLTDCPNLTVTCADGNVYHYVNGTCID